MPNIGRGKGKGVAPGDEDEQENPLIASDEAEAEAAYTDLGKLVEILEPGDHIATTRKKGLYEHHGIYEGVFRGYPSVIHFQGPLGPSAKGSASSMSCAKCAYQQPKEGGIVITCLDCFSLGQNTYKLQYKLQPGFLTKRDPNWNQLIPGHVIKEYRRKYYYLELYKEDQIYGHSQIGKKWRFSYKLEDRVRFYKVCSSLTSGQEVLDTAWSMSAQVGPYHLRNNNCEHFAVFCKTGKGKSLQIYKFFKSMFCNRGKVASPFSYGRISNEWEDVHMNLSRKKRDYSEAMEGVKKEEAALLKSYGFAERNKPSKFDNTLRKLFLCCG